MADKAAGCRMVEGLIVAVRQDSCAKKMDAVFVVVCSWLNVQEEQEEQTNRPSSKD